MTASSTSTLDFTAVLTNAVASYRGETKQLRPTPGEVVDALLLAEKTAKQQKIIYPFEALQGKWRLCFATGTKKVRQRGGIVLGKGFYMPKFTPAYISFSGEGEISNQIQVGSLKLKLTGLARYLGKKNLLAFDFMQMRVSLFGAAVYDGSIRGGKAKAEQFSDQPIAKLPFFAFFLVTDDFIAARGRGGGLALWIRDRH